MIRHYATIALALVLLACAVRITYLGAQLRRAHDSERRLALEASNLHALHDTTVNVARVNPRVASLLGDTLRAYGRRVVQVPPRRDHLDEAAGVEHAGAYVAAVQVKPLDARVTTPHADTTQFHIRQEPYTLDAQLAHQPVGDSMTLAVAIALDTIPISLRLGCRDPGAAGIREASVMLLTPPWAAVRFGAVEQDPAICNPAHSAAHNAGRRRFAWAPIALSVGRTIGPGPSGWTAQLGTAIVFGAP